MGKRKTVVGLLAVGAAALLLLVGLVAWDVHGARGITTGRLAELLAVERRTVRLEDLSPERERVLLAVEDPSFWQHDGVDVDTPGQGLTTITQSLAKRLYFPEGFQPGLAKVRQTLLAAHALHVEVPKRTQLNAFANLASFGDRDGRAITGFADAAAVFFGTSFASLSDDEFLALVTMLIAPDRLRPGTPAHAARLERIRQVLSGQIRPASVFDVEYTGRARGSLTEEAFRVFVRLVT